MNTRVYSDTGIGKSEKPAASNVAEYSVSEISGALKKTVEERFGHVRVRGEVSGYRGPHSSGHSYFSLKDERARIDAIIWKGVASKLKHLPEEGLEVIATGKFTTYPNSSKYQIVIESLEPAGAGALMALLEERRKKLAAEGLFDEARKQLLPFMPRHIGVITSPTGAVIRDVLHRISDRFPLHVSVWPVRVQGETTGVEVSAAIDGFNAMANPPDLIIVARGGGSIEDLWGFNDEAVVRAAADSMVPLISAIGHETDWTLLDHAADRRAPTPTGAAEMAVPVRADLEATLASLYARLKGGLSQRIERAQSTLLASERGLPSSDSLFALPRRRLDDASGQLTRGLELAVRTKHTAFERIGGKLSRSSLTNRLERAADRLENTSDRLSTAQLRTIERAENRLAPLLPRVRQAHRSSLSRARDRLHERSSRLAPTAAKLFERRNVSLNASDRMLASLSYKRVLERGYAVVRDGDSYPVSSAASLTEGSTFTVELKDGMVDAVAGVENGAGIPAQPKRQKKSKPAKVTLGDPQAGLFD